MAELELFGLLGCNIDYSRSPEIFYKLWGGEATNREYHLVDTSNPELFIREVQQTPEWKGFSVTIPYKEWIIPHLDSLTSVSSAIGAVNAVRVSDGLLTGHNTDVSGFLSPINPLLEDGTLPPKSHALLLGSGGAAKAVRYGLESRGIQVTTVSRSKERGDITYDEISVEILSQTKLIVNATPLGGKQYPNTAPPIPYQFLDSRHILYDLTYTVGSQFLAVAPSDCLLINGLPMLEAQAVSAYHFFLTGEI